MKGGSPRLLFELAQEAICRCDAPLSFVGKGLRGRRLAEGISDSPEQRIDLRLDAEATVELAFQQIVAACLQQASINEEILRQRPESVEAIHGMRIAIRRLRAALSLFAEMIEGDDLGGLKQELKWMSDLLGAARDLDVLVAGPVRNARLRHPDLEGLEELRDKSEELRQAAHRGLNEAIHSERFRRLLLGIVEFAQAGAWSRDASPERRKLRSVAIVAFAPEELDRRLRSICKKKSRVAIVGENELDRHRVRIKAKKLRYIAEFLKSLARTKDYEKTSVALKKLQSTLGDVHDAVAAEQIVSQDPREGEQRRARVRRQHLAWRNRRSRELNRESVRRARRTAAFDAVLAEVAAALSVSSCTGLTRCDNHRSRRLDARLGAGPHGEPPRFQLLFGRRLRSNAKIGTPAMTEARHQNSSKPVLGVAPAGSREFRLNSTPSSRRSSFFPTRTTPKLRRDPTYRRRPQITTELIGSAAPVAVIARSPCDEATRGLPMRGPSIASLR